MPEQKPKRAGSGRFKKQLFAVVSSREMGGSVAVSCTADSIGETVAGLLRGTDGEDTVTVTAVRYSQKEYEALEEFGGW